jgi:hypothetical protein
MANLTRFSRRSGSGLGMFRLIADQAAAAKAERQKPAPTVTPEPPTAQDHADAARRRDNWADMVAYIQSGCPNSEFAHLATPPATELEARQRESATSNVMAMLRGSSIDPLPPVDPTAAAILRAVALVERGTDATAPPPPRLDSTDPAEVLAAQILAAARKARGET